MKAIKEELYMSGEYLKRNPSWHIEESVWKAKHVLRMLTLNSVVPTTVCEVGCGAGEVLKTLQEDLGDHCLFWGYDVSPHALELASSRANERLHFKLTDIQQEQGVHFDVILMLDVIEHLEDYFGMLRDIKPKAEYKIFHIPLDLSVQTVLRRYGLLKVRDWYGHIHYFTKDIALRVLDDAGYEVLDYSYTARAIEQPTNEIKRNLLKLPRTLLFMINKDLTARILGGWSLLVLAK